MKLLNRKLSDKAVRELAVGLVVEGLPSGRPQDLPHVAAIYFVIEGGEIVYIGETKDLRTRRWGTYPQGTSPTCQVRWMETQRIPYSYLRRRIERVLIARFRPRLNTQYRDVPLAFAHLSGKDYYSPFRAKQKALNQTQSKDKRRPLLSLGARGLTGFPNLNGN